MTLATQYRGRSRTSELATTNGFNASPDGGEDSACRGKPEAESGGARWISSLPNAQDPPPPPSAAATSHTSTHAVGSRNNPFSRFQIDPIVRTTEVSRNGTSPA